MMQVFNLAETRQIVDRYVNGESMKDIARCFRCCPNKIRDCLRAQGIRFGAWLGGQATCGRSK